MKRGIQNLFRVCGITAGTVMLCLGVYREETEAIFRKAVKICLECIGIG